MHHHGALGTELAIDSKRHMALADVACAAGDFRAVNFAFKFLPRFQNKHY
jgi:hypothetical protein